MIPLSANVQAAINGTLTQYFYTVKINKPSVPITGYIGTSANAGVTISAASDILTVTTANIGDLNGQVSLITATGVTANTKIIIQLTSTEVGGALGGKGTYRIDSSQSVTVRNMSCDVVLKAITSHYASITMSDTFTYLGDGSLFGIDPPQSNTHVDREQYKIQISDPDFSDSSLVTAGFIGAYATVRLGFLDNATEQPLTSLSDTLICYGGRVDNTSYLIKTSELGEALLQLTCSSPMADLDYKKYIFLSREFIRARNKTDSSCDFITSGSGNLQLKWGRS